MKLFSKNVFTDRALKMLTFYFCWFKRRGAHVKKVGASLGRKV